MRFGLTPAEARKICELGQVIKRTAADQLEAVHPTNPEIPGITQVEFTGPLDRTADGLRSRNAVVVSPGGSTVPRAGPAPRHVSRPCMPGV